jgi:solute carrier family 25 (adenine nucleotide translocator) protein 4/5/6/31
MSTPETPTKDLARFAAHFLAGGISGIISKTIAAPIERIKILLQNSDAHQKIQADPSKRYSGTYPTFRRIISEEGMRYLWRGNLANCVRYSITQAFNFAFKEEFKISIDKAFFPNPTKIPDSQKTFKYRLTRNIVSAGSAGMISYMIGIFLKKILGVKTSG